MRVGATMSGQTEVDESRSEPPNDARIDYMTEEDLPAVLANEAACFDEPWREEVFRAELRHCWSHCRVLRRRSTGEVLGHLVFWSVADEVHLLNMAVVPSERHHRYGRMLLDDLLDFARSHGARFVTLEVRSSNHPAMTLYESAGFKRVGVRLGYYANNGEDAVVMLYDLGPEDEAAVSDEAGLNDHCA